MSADSNGGNVGAVAEARPYELLGRRLVGENTRFEIWFDHIRNPETEVPAYLVLGHKVVLPGPSGITGVAVLPETNGRLVLVRIYRHPRQRWGWEVPRGFIDAGEDVATAALRELREETGYEGSRDRLISTGLVEPEPGIIDGASSTFIAYCCREIAGAGTDEIGLGCRQAFTSAEIDALVAAGEIRDAVTLALLFHYRSRGGVTASPACSGAPARDSEPTG